MYGHLSEWKKSCINLGKNDLGDSFTTSSDHTLCNCSKHSLHTYKALTSRSHINIFMYSLGGVVFAWEHIGREIAHKVLT
jgi:hypothetical protein